MKVGLISSAVATILALQVQSSEVHKGMTYQEFKTSLSSIAKSFADSPDASSLLMKPEFDHLFDHAGEYRAMAMQLLQEDVPDQEKKILIYAMQNLKLDDYLFFLNDLLALTRENKISADLFERALIPGFEWNTKLQENWNSPKVRGLIENIRRSRLLPARCDQYLNDVSSGQGAEHVKRLRLDGELR